MKKFILPFGLLAFVIFVSFKKINRPLATVSKTAKTELPICAPPTNLNVVKNSSGGGTSLVFSWSSSGAVQWSYGGYYNYAGGTVFFGYPTYTWPVAISVPASTYSVTFRVTAVCAGGGSSNSDPFSKQF